MILQIPISFSLSYFPIERIDQPRNKKIYLIHYIRINYTKIDGSTISFALLSLN